MKKNNTAPLAMGLIMFVFIFVFAEQFAAGFATGLENCAKVVIPSLFPFLVASSLTGSGSLPAPLKRFAEPVTQRLFKLPAESLPAIILSQLGGYLAGAKAAESLCKSGTLTPNQSSRLLLFGVNAGMGFAINVVGRVLLGSREAGRILLFSLCASSLIIGILSSIFTKNDNSCLGCAKKSVSLSQATVESVTGSAEAMLTSCGFVCVFSGFCSVIEKYINNESLATAISCLLEITNGCVKACGKISLPMLAAACAFGGLCVHLQLFAIAKNTSIKISTFYFFRILHAAVSYFVCSVTLYFHPIERLVFLSVSENAALWSFSTPAAISLLFLSALLILDLESERKIC